MPTCRWRASGAPDSARRCSSTRSCRCPRAPRTAVTYDPAVLRRSGTGSRTASPAGLQLGRSSIPTRTRAISPTRSAFPSSRLRRVWVGADDDVIKPGSTPDDSVFRVFVYASFIPLHGLEHVVRAAHLLEQHDDGIRIEIVGAGDTEATDPAARRRARRPERAVPRSPSLRRAPQPDGGEPCVPRDLRHVGKGAARHPEQGVRRARRGAGGHHRRHAGRARGAHPRGHRVAVRARRSARAGRLDPGPPRRAGCSGADRPAWVTSCSSRSSVSTRSRPISRPSCSRCSDARRPVDACATSRSTCPSSIPSPRTTRGGDPGSPSGSTSRGATRLFRGHDQPRPARRPRVLRPPAPRDPPGAGRARGAPRHRRVLLLPLLVSRPEAARAPLRGGVPLG